jgi:hypothetical protein
MLLSGGEMIKNGKVENLPAFFKEQGRPLNPA